jgi:hypothetical protein
MAARTRKLRFQQLEAKQLMAGDVLASVDAAGNLNVLEAASDVNEAQTIEIIQTEAGYTKVTGTDGTLVNGYEYQLFQVRPTAAINVALGGGNDMVAVRGVQMGSLNLDLGRQSYTGQDRDIVEVSSTNLTGELRINTLSRGAGEADQDGVSLTDVAANGGISVSTGFSSDAIEMTRVVSGTERSSATLSISADDLQSDRGAGNDTVILRNVDSFGLAAIYTGRPGLGIDTDAVNIQSMTVRGSLITSMGDGENRFTANNLNVERDLSYFGDQGVDHIDIAFARIGGDLSISTGASNDEVTISDSRVGRVAEISTGDGADSVDMRRNVMMAIDIALGDNALAAGTDRLTMIGNRALFLLADGGPGVNARDIQNNSFWNQAWSNF